MSSQNIEEAAKIKSRSETAMATQPDNSCQIAAANKCSHKENGSGGIAWTARFRAAFYQKVTPRTQTFEIRA
jgi:hypothetical protein